MAALRRVGDALLTDRQEFLLGDCVQAYPDNDPAEQRRFRRIIEANARGRITAMQRNKTLIDRARERSREEGIQVGEGEGHLRASRAAVTEQAETEFGPLPHELTDRVTCCEDVALLRQCLMAIRPAENLDDFRIATGL